MVKDSQPQNQLMTGSGEILSDDNIKTHVPKDPQPKNNGGNSESVRIEESPEMGKAMSRSKNKTVDPDKFKPKDAIQVQDHKNES